MITWWDFFLITNNKWGENEGTIGRFTFTTCNGYVVTVAPSLAIAPTKKTFWMIGRCLFTNIQSMGRYIYIYIYIYMLSTYFI